MEYKVTGKGSPAAEGGLHFSALSARVVWTCKALEQFNRRPVRDIIENLRDQGLQVFVREGPRCAWRKVHTLGELLI